MRGISLKGICQLNERNYEKFEERLNQIFQYDFMSFEKKLSNKTSYLIYSDKNTNTTQMLKKRISNIINYE